MSFFTLSVFIMPPKPNKGDLSLPPPLQLVEQQVASKRQQAKLKKDEKDGARPKDTVTSKTGSKTPVKMEEDQPRAESTPSASAKTLPVSMVDPVLSSGSDSDETGLDAEIAELEKSIKETIQQIDTSKQRLRVREKKEKAARLKSQLEYAQKELQRTKEIGMKTSSEKKHEPKKKTKVKSSIITPSQKDSDIDSDSEIKISDLKKMKHLVKSADKKMSSLGLCCSSEDANSESSSSSSSDDSSLALSSGDEGKKSKHKKKKHSKSKKSGMVKKPSDKVKYPQTWPQSVLQYEFVSDKTTFENLDLKLFAAGEIEIILSDSISSTERKNRLLLLRKILYYANVYDWQGLLNFYAAWLRRIESGLSKWGDDPTIIEIPMLARHVIKKSADKAADAIFWCPDYNNGKCSVSAKSHQKIIKNRTRTVQHICSTCWRKDKKQLSHPETSFACPYKI